MNGTTYNLNGIQYKTNVPLCMQEIYVSHGKKGSSLLEKALSLKDAISDLPLVCD